MGLVRLIGQGDVPASVRAPPGRGPLGLQIIEGDLLEQVGDQLLLVRPRLGAEQIHQFPGRGIGRCAEGVAAKHFAQGRIHPVLAQFLLQPVHDQSALAVVDVALVLNPLQGQLLDQVTAPGPEIVVQLELQKLVDLSGAVELLHGHQGGVLGQGLVQHGGALHVPADQLVRPPLMTQLVGGHIGDHVDLFRVPGVDDPAEIFGIGNGVRKGLGEIRIGWELQDPDLAKLIRAEVRLVVVQPDLQGTEHPVDIPAVAGVMVDGQVDALVALRLHGIGGGLDGEEPQDRRLRAEPRDPVSVHHRV